MKRISILKSIFLAAGIFCLPTSGRAELGIGPELIIESYDNQVMYDYLPINENNFCKDVDFISTTKKNLNPGDSFKILNTKDEPIAIFFGKNQNTQIFNVSFLPDVAYDSDNCDPDDDWTNLTGVVLTGSIYAIQSDSPIGIGVGNNVDDLKLKECYNCDEISIEQQIDLKAYHLSPNASINVTFKKLEEEPPPPPQNQGPDINLAESDYVAIGLLCDNNDMEGILQCDPKPQQPPMLNITYVNGDHFEYLHEELHSLQSYKLYTGQNSVVVNANLVDKNILQFSTLKGDEFFTKIEILAMENGQEVVKKTIDTPQMIKATFVAKDAGIQYIKSMEAYDFVLGKDSQFTQDKVITVKVSAPFSVEGNPLPPQDPQDPQEPQDPQDPQPNPQENPDPKDHQDQDDGDHNHEGGIVFYIINNGCSLQTTGTGSNAPFASAMILGLGTLGMLRAQRSLKK